MKNGNVRSKGIPEVQYYGSHLGKNFMVMDLLGPSID
jgi:hypothetical protein